MYGYVKATCEPHYAVPRQPSQVLPLFRKLGIGQRKIILGEKCLTAVEVPSTYLTETVADDCTVFLCYRSITALQKSTDKTILLSTNLFIKM